MKVTYLDHAASSWPKPPEVAKAVAWWVENNGANPGRGSHRLAMEASRMIYECRQNLAALFGIRNPLDLSFAANATAALNLAIRGSLREGDHVICTEIEHNAVRRPLEYLKRTKSISVTYLPADEEGQVDTNQVKAAFRPETKLFVCSHGSNVLGSILPVAEYGRICREAGVRFLVDAAQTAGSVPIDVERMNIDMLAFPGHKGLLGPQGTGGLYVRADIRLDPLLYGGTGGNSEEIDQPETRPDRYEAGTVNTPGIAGLNEGVKFIRKETPEAIHKREWELAQELIEGLREIEGMVVLGPKAGEDRTGVVSFVHPDIDPAEMAMILDQTYGIAVRSGFHCSPLGHHTAGTMETGAVRASLGYSSSREEVIYFIRAVREIAEAYAV